MDIQTVRLKKVELSRYITDAINLFETMTETKVEYLQIQRESMLKMKRLVNKTIIDIVI